ncbi:hypothetical protein OUZ56_022719 [Daphnia magna]|uniref:Uncharacterized protein n=1 Tax=Daphnia magna TaxID=35525 RepID=A0ABR0AXC9_9CRUS|nr:hypothetical protein OUZ56_022719 [Daphnia magna]
MAYSSGRVVVWGTWLSCPRNSMMYRSNPNQVPVSKWSMLWSRKAGSAALTEFNQRCLPRKFIIDNVQHIHMKRVSTEPSNDVIELWGSLRPLLIRALQTSGRDPP